MPQWNKRFVIYSAVHSRTPRQQLKHDRKFWPGGVMTGFSLWIRTSLREFAKKHPKLMFCGTFTDHKAFDDFLRSKI